MDRIKTESDRLPANYLFLDEISSVGDWPYAIKWLADSGFLSNSKIILTGSSSISLKKKGEFLPGRRGSGKDIIFLPLKFFDCFNLLHLGSFDDLKQAKRKASIKEIDLKKNYERFLLTGGFLKMLDTTVKKNEEPGIYHAGNYCHSLSRNSSF